MAVSRFHCPDLRSVCVSFPNKTHGAETLFAIARGISSPIPLPTYLLLHRLYCNTYTPPVRTLQQRTHLRSPDLVAMEYADLNLSHKVYQDSSHVRIRQHVNPLSSSFSAPAKIADWHQVFQDPKLPLMVDIGCGSGRFLMSLAKRSPEPRNYLGLELRQKLVQRAELWVKELALSNIHFLFANGTVSFKHLALSYPGPLILVSVLCPDPHFKKRHHKRRAVKKPLVHSIVDALMVGGQVFIQSDVLEVAVDMRNQFDEEPLLVHIDACDSSFLCDSEGWLLKNPMGIRTEREIHAEFEGAKVYRRLYQKQNFPSQMQTLVMPS